MFRDTVALNVVAQLYQPQRHKETPRMRQHSGAMIHLMKAGRHDN